MSDTAIEALRYSEFPNSSDCISRRAAIDALSEAGLINYAATGDGNGMIQAVNVIKGLPPARPEISILTVTVAPDPQEIERVVRKIKDAPVMILPSSEPERRKGKWIKNDNGTYSCSVCQSWIPEEQRHYARYCLHCGADMRGEQDE